MTDYYIVALVATLLTAFSQIILKIAALRWDGRNVLRLYLNVWAAGGYLLLLLVTLLNLYAFKYIPLKSAVFLLPLTLLVVVVLSRWIFHERLSGTALLGAFLVILGVAIQNL